MKNATKGQTLPKEVYSKEEIHSLIATFSRKCPTGIRNRALIVLGYRTGLRLGEALDLSPKDVDLDKGAVHVRHGKGDKSRKVGIDPTALEFVALWVTERAKLGLPKGSPFFCTLKGEPIEQPYIRAMLKRKGAKAGIEKRVHFHALRHSFAHDLVTEGKNIVLIQKSLGHTNLNTTQTYVDHVAPKALIDMAQGRGEW